MELMKRNSGSQNICEQKINITQFLNRSVKFGLIENENYKKNIYNNSHTYNSLFFFC